MELLVYGDDYTLFEEFYDEVKEMKDKVVENISDLKRKYLLNLVDSDRKAELLEKIRGSRNTLAVSIETVEKLISQLDRRDDIIRPPSPPTLATPVLGSGVTSRSSEDHFLEYGL